MPSRAEQNNIDESWMMKALQLAERGAGHTYPNPPVGAVIVKNNTMIGSGYHHKAGRPHAEVMAVHDAKERSLKGSTLYVTLEPCSTRGRTPSCTDLILQSGISKVVVSAKDPNPKHRGRGLRILKRSGIAIKSGVLGDDGKALIRPFAKWITTGRPFVLLKLGMSIDGRIGDFKRSSQWITSSASRAYVHAVRRRSDAVMVGIGTVLADNPSLTVRGRKNDPLYRIVCDTEGKTPLDSKILNDFARRRTILAVTKKCTETCIEKMRDKGVDVVVLKSAGGKVSLKDLMRILGKRGFTNILCEGGGELAASLIKDKLVDEYCFFLAPKILGGKESVPAIAGKGWLLEHAPLLKITDTQMIGPDVLIKCVPKE